MIFTKKTKVQQTKNVTLQCSKIDLRFSEVVNKRIRYFKHGNNAINKNRRHLRQVYGLTVNNNIT